MKENIVFGCLVAGAVALVVGILTLPFTLVWGIPAGHVGIVSVFGEVSDETLPAGGPYFVKPWKSVIRTSVQTQKNDEPATVPTKGGLAVNMHSVMLYKLDPAAAPRVRREVGEKYEEVLIDPYFKNAVRDVCSEYAPEALYTNERVQVEAAVLARVQKELGPRGIIVESIMLQDPVLPPVVADRIQAKVAAEQDAIRMQSVFKQREQEGLANKRTKELEAEAKVIEAKGIAEAQNIIKKDLDENYLRYLWIEALKESAKHNNATIYIPTGTDGMPLMKTVHPGHDKLTK